MKYPDGNEVRLGDKVRLWAGAEGVVVCSLDTLEFSDEYPEKEWGYLQKGVLIATPEAGLIHYLEPDATMELIERKVSRGGTPREE
jgi:hypothetical protein